jgi:outer membrane biosynthesis protein TonB
VLPFATRLAILFFASYTVFAQTDAPFPAAAAGVLLVKLSPPVYPPLARQARIMGDVRIQLAIRRDGSIESSEVVSGHPLLKHAATLLTSHNLSRFGCLSIFHSGYVI